MQIAWIKFSLPDQDLHSLSCTLCLTVELAIGSLQSELHYVAKIESDDNSNLLLENTISKNQVLNWIPVLIDFSLTLKAAT